MQSLKIVLCSLMLFVPQLVHADGTAEPAPHVENYSLGDLDSDKQKALKLDNQIEILKKEIQLEELNSKRNGGGEQAPKVTDEKPVDTPWVSSISGNNGKLYSTIQYPDGSSVTVSEGDALPKGGRVIRISRSGVAVEQKGTVDIFAMSPAVRRSSATEVPSSKRPSVFDSTKGGI